MTLLDPTLIDRLSAAMSISTLAHRVSAHNVANRDALGHQRMKLQFDAAMATAAAPSSRRTLKVMEAVYS